MHSFSILCFSEILHSCLHSISFLLAFSEVCHTQTRRYYETFVHAFFSLPPCVCACIRAFSRCIRLTHNCGLSTRCIAISTMDFCMSVVPFYSVNVAQYTRKLFQNIACACMGACCLCVCFEYIFSNLSFACLLARKLHAYVCCVYEPYVYVMLILHFSAAIFLSFPNRKKLHSNSLHIHCTAHIHLQKNCNQ